MKKKLKIFALSLIGIAVLLFAVLIIHIIVMVKKEGQIPNATMQLARVDFGQPIDSSSLINIQNKVKNMKGVKNTYYNAKANILVYGYDNRLNNAKNIFNLAIKNNGVIAQPHVVSSKQANTGCPAMGGNSFYSKITKIIYKLVY
ncbi:hypothetical protein [Rhizosphaericola mali]|uniref:Uncharacterized protein n=1 Tax=Rhizosphaericola mali TaxID=2545455 RepID=A0A5P2G5D3_9BACT|nr:hypothetical protein [Rhizosphaericola mali]QES88313.1 hypothetical protein E0W69_006410 [Rhizosphaericola mali]